MKKRTIYTGILTGVAALFLFGITGCKEDEVPKVDPINGPYFNLRYCEMLIGALNGGQVQADIYTTQGCNSCPQADWESLDLNAVAAEYNAMLATGNGPRYWVLDSIDGSQNPIGDLCADTIGTIPMTLVGSLLVSTSSQSSAAYEPITVSRTTIFRFNEGREVYQLKSSSGDCFIMQSYTEMSDPNLSLETLPMLGESLDLPSGWSFSTHVLESNFELSTINGQATVVTDDLSNSYQQLNEGCLEN